MKTKFTIISDPIRSGKTSRLIHWLNQHPQVFGILMPDLAGKRKMYFNNLNLVVPLEVYEKDFSESKMVQIGRFTFLKEPFLFAQQLLLDAINHSINDIVIDEIGKLEFKNNAGFEPILSEGLKLLSLESKRRNCFLVVRDYLLEETQRHYNLQGAETIGSQQLVEVIPVIPMEILALVLCGGFSRRMKKPKALLNYHELPQYLWLNHLVQPFVNDVYISCKKEQSGWFDQNLKQIHDNPDYNNGGPLAGLLSLIETNITSAILIIGCDYPLLSKEYVQQLTEACQLFNCTIALSKSVDEPLEPMLCCIHPKDFKTIQNLYFDKKENSLCKILKHLNSIKIVVEHPNNIKSFDTPTEFSSFQTYL